MIVAIIIKITWNYNFIICQVPQLKSKLNFMTPGRAEPHQNEFVRTSEMGRNGVLMMNRKTKIIIVQM